MSYAPTILTNLNHLDCSYVSSVMSSMDFEYLASDLWNKIHWLPYREILYDEIDLQSDNFHTNNQRRFSDDRL